MSFDYAGLKTDVEEILEEMGAACTLTRPVDTSFTPETGAVVDGTALTYAGFAVLWEWDSGDKGGKAGFSDLTQTVTESLLFICGGLTVKPNKADTLTFDSIVYQIVHAQPLAPGATVLYYAVEARI